MNNVGSGIEIVDIDDFNATVQFFNDKVTFKPQRSFEEFITLKKGEGLTWKDTFQSRFVQYYNEEGFFKTLKNLLLGAWIGIFVANVRPAVEEKSIGGKITEQVKHGEVENIKALEKETQFYRMMMKTQRAYNAFRGRPTSTTHQKVSEVFEELHQFGKDNSITVADLNGLINRHVGRDVAHHLLQFCAENALNPGQGLSQENLLSFFANIDATVAGKVRHGYGTTDTVRTAFAQGLWTILNQTPQGANHDVLKRATDLLCGGITPESLNGVLLDILEGKTPHSYLKTLIPSGTIQSVEILRTLLSEREEISTQLAQAQEDLRVSEQQSFSLTQEEIQDGFDNDAPQHLCNAIAAKQDEIADCENKRQAAEQQYHEQIKNIMDEYNESVAAQDKIMAEQQGIVDSYSDILADWRIELTEAEETASRAREEYERVRGFAWGLFADRERPDFTKARADDAAARDRVAALKTAILEAEQKIEVARSAIQACETTKNTLLNDYGARSRAVTQAYDDQCDELETELNTLRSHTYHVTAEEMLYSEGGHRFSHLQSWRDKKAMIEALELRREAIEARIQKISYKVDYDHTSNQFSSITQDHVDEQVKESTNELQRILAWYYEEGAPSEKKVEFWSRRVTMGIFDPVAYPGRFIHGEDHSSTSDDSGDDNEISISQDVDTSSDLIIDMTNINLDDK